MLRRDAVTDDREKPKDERKPQRETPNETPPAGPHDRPDLTNPDATPGTGILPRGDDATKRDVDPGGG